jgi:ribonuclease HI
LKPIASDWVRKQFKGNKVWMATDSSGNPLVKNDKVLIKYQLNQDYEYWVNPAHLHDIDATGLVKQHDGVSVKQKKKSREAKEQDRPIIPEKGVITIFTDGASSGNPGPSGIGIVMKYGRHQREISKYIGNTTNNVAELKAVETALSELKRKDLSVRLYTDSKYVYSLLCEGWKAKKNLELVKAVKQLMSNFSDLKIIKVKGHAGVDGNEQADRLATEAIETRK